MDCFVGVIFLGVLILFFDKFVDVIFKQFGVKERDFDVVEGYNFDFNCYGDCYFFVGI